MAKSHIEAPGYGGEPSASKQVGSPGDSVSTLTCTRRHVLRVSAATAALFALAGCSSLRGKGGSPLHEAYLNLQRTLDELAQDEKEQGQLSSIARRIENRCRELTQEHDEFRSRFDARSSRLETTSAELDKLVSDFSSRRTMQRNGIFSLQDELRHALTEEEWAQAVKALTQTQEAYTRPSIGRS